MNRREGHDVEILQLTMTGNIVGIISFIVGVIEVLLIVITKKYVKKNEKQIKEEKA